ncbi:hypothetical protein AB0M02_44145 [Actinoplanes sp. NPDC051861]|uniref:hypothetical protein n=1 Tax=Actinoplanes sp. NPDC051861 TaxID=3155170 RepID=UPI00343CDEA9
MSDINPENWAEFTTQDGPEEPSVGDEGLPRIEDLQPRDFVSDPSRQIILLPAAIDR